MRKIRSFSLALSGALLLGALSAFPGLAQSPAAGEVQLAQQDTRSEEYLPPWQRGKSGDGSADEPSQPQAISPPPADSDPVPPSGTAQGAYDPDYNDTTAAAPDPQYDRDYRDPDTTPPQGRPVYEDDEGYSSNEIVDAGHRFFGGVSKGLADVVEHVFSRQGRPNGYILGEEAGGAFIAGLRYGEGTLYTKNAGKHRVYWQGPSIGYDFGAEGSKTMILVYNLRDVNQIYHRFAGVDGSAYLVGGVGVTFQTHDDIVLAPIRSGVGVRLGANVGYLKYTRSPTWNPF